MTARLGEYVVASGARPTRPPCCTRRSTAGSRRARSRRCGRILLLDGPAVLGWDAFRDIMLRHGLGLTEAMLQAAMDAGQLPPQPPRPLAHVVIGALDEAAMYVTTAEDRAAARDEVARALHAMLDGMLR